jgi:hypothetical protein
LFIDLSFSVSSIIFDEYFFFKKSYCLLYFANRSSAFNFHFSFQCSMFIFNFNFASSNCSFNCCSFVFLSCVISLIASCFFFSYSSLRR